MRALHWIVDLLRTAGVPFQIVGGLAARAYGAERALVDFDFYVPTDCLRQVADLAAAFVTRPPSHYRDGDWELDFMKLEYEGRVIELGGADGARYFDRRAGRWRDANINFASSVERCLFGVPAPVMPLAQLVEYKQALDREVDRQDLMELAAAHDTETRGPTEGNGLT